MGTKCSNRVSKLTLNEVEEIKQVNTELTSSDIELEALLTKQRAHYIKLCIAHNIKSLPIKVNLFKATDCFECGKIVKECLKYGKTIDDENEISCILPKLGKWENYNISIDYHDITGNHYTILKDSNNRNLLVRKLNQSLLSSTM